MNRKLKSNAGETLVETLFALLVVGLAMTMLVGAIMAAARVNKGARDLDTSFQATNNPGSGVNVTVIHTKHNTVPNTLVPVTVYQTNDQNHYYYYTSVPSAG